MLDPKIALVYSRLGNFIGLDTIGVIMLWTCVMLVMKSVEQMATASRTQVNELKQ